MLWRRAVLLLMLYVRINGEDIRVTHNPLVVDLGAGISRVEKSLILDKR